MSSPGLASRHRSAYAAKQAAKQKRQRNIAIAAFIVLVIVAAFEVPHIIKQLKGSSSPAPIASVQQPTTTATKPPAIPRALRRRAAPDPFGAAAALSSDDPGIAPATGGRDPFMAGSSSSETSSTQPSQSTAAATRLLPEKIVIGKPGGGRVAVHGWIVILASIPTPEGRASADSFARGAAHSGIRSLSILNSSNRRPLRGGYWVVYSGPFSTLTQVSSRANAVHAAGFHGAYIRELIVYRKK